MSISIRRANRLIDAAGAWHLLSAIEAYYPDLSDWYWNKAIPDVMLGTGTLLIAEDPNGIAGVALGKKSAAETKLRCVRMRPDLQGRGLGLKLIDAALRSLDCDKPLLTVPEELIHDYGRPFVNRYGFSLDLVKGLYRPGKLEYQFNGRQDQRAATAYGLH